MATTNGEWIGEEEDDGFNPNKNSVLSSMPSDQRCEMSSRITAAFGRCRRLEMGSAAFKTMFDVFCESKFHHQ
jgi:hypothetical protein